MIVSGQQLVEAQDIKKVFRAENHIAGDWIIHYQQRKKDHDQRRIEIEAGAKDKDENVGGGRSSVIGRPTEALAMALAGHDNNCTARWLKVVELVMCIVGQKKRLLIELRQECRYYIGPNGGRPNWITPVQQRYADAMGRPPAEYELKKMWNEIIILAVRLAKDDKIRCKF